MDRKDATPGFEDPLSAEGMMVEKPVQRISVMDHHAFAEKYLADLGQEEADFQVCHWPIQSWHALDKRITGPEFECGGHRWRILLFPFGNSNGQPYDMVSVYLDYADNKDTPEGFHACAQFALVISNPNDPTLFSTSQAHHRFTTEEMDWGFTRFNEFRKLAVPLDKRTRPIIEDDQAVVSAFVRVLKDPTGVLWHNFINYDSKKETGYVGMKNQGATCYMNSLLQSLFFTNYFRRAVYQIPTENDIPTDSVAYALQRVFYQLQTSHQPVGTTELTKSFGWKSLDSFLQHDVQEFNRVLQEKLEIKMKGTAADGAINRLFVGKMKSFLRCVNVQYESARSEDFYDIQLNVKGMLNLEQSFWNYIQTEMLEGDNKYHAEGYGLQDAEKGVVFEKFPPVLHLQLKRFEYDLEKDMMVKINDRHEFPLSIDLKPFLIQEAQHEPWVYKLHGVLVHSGDLHGGHYFALIKPEPDSNWFKFDDDRVTPATLKEVLEDNFGGEMVPPGGINRHPSATAPIRAMKRFTNAYMLVYVRESMMDEVLKPIGPADVPDYLSERIEDERLQLEVRRREREEQRREGQQPEQVQRRQRIRRGQILDPQHERLVAHLDRQQQHLVQRVEDRDLDQRRQAARERIDLLRLVQRHDLLLLALLVVLVAFLDRLHLGLDRTHRGHAAKLALRDREDEQTDRQRQQDDRDAEIAHQTEQQIEIIEDRLLDQAEPAPVERIIELRRGTVVGILIEQLHFLRAREEARRLRYLRTRSEHLRRTGEITLIGLASTGAELPVEAARLVGDQRGQPVFVGEAQPAALGCETLRTLVDVLEVGAVVRRIVVHRHRTGVDCPAVRVLRHAGAVDQRVASHRHRRLARVRHCLADGEQIVVVDRQIDAEALSARVRCGQRYRTTGSEDVGGSGPHCVRRRRHQPTIAPAELREIRLGCARGRQQPDRCRVLGNRFLVIGQHQVVDPRAAQVDRPLQAWRLDAHARALRQHRATVAHRGRAVRGRIGTGLRQCFRLAIDDLGRGRVRGREEPALRQRPAEQDQRRDHREHDEILVVVVHSAPQLVITEPDRVRVRPKDGSARSA